MHKTFYEYIQFLDSQNVKYRTSANEYVWFSYTHRIELEDSIAFFDLWRVHREKVETFSKWTRNCIAFTANGCRVVALLDLWEIEEVKQMIAEAEVVEAIF